MPIDLCSSWRSLWGSERARVHHAGDRKDVRVHIGSMHRGVGRREWRKLDEAAANIAAGLSRTPGGKTWHHSEREGDMELVDGDVHQEIAHTGGYGIHR